APLAQRSRPQPGVFLLMPASGRDASRRSSDTPAVMPGKGSLPPAFSAKSSAGRPRVLFVSPVSPFPDTFGAAQRTRAIHEALAEDFEVDLVVGSIATLKPEERQTLHERYRLVGTLDGFLGPAWRRTALALEMISRNVLGLIFPALRRSYQPFPPAVAGMNRLISAGRYQLIVGRYLRPSVWCGRHHQPCARRADAVGASWARVLHSAAERRVLPRACGGLLDPSVAVLVARPEVGGRLRREVAGRQAVVGVDLQGNRELVNTALAEARARDASATKCGLGVVVQATPHRG